MTTVRLRRLQADYDRLDEYVRRHPRVKLVRVEGNPPESYQIEYELRSLRLVHDEMKTVQSHVVEIVLPGSYPRLPPQCRMLTPIFHPNIAPHAICIGDHWSAGEPLWSIVARIGEMIAYQSYNIKSPLNGEAARWVSENLDQLPLDPVSMLIEDRPRKEVGTPPPASPEPIVPPAPSAGEAVDEKVVVECEKCHARLRVSPTLGGKRVRCPRCQVVFTVAPPP